MRTLFHLVHLPGYWMWATQSHKPTMTGDSLCHPKKQKHKNCVFGHGVLLVLPRSCSDVITFVSLRFHVWHVGPMFGSWCFEWEDPLIRCQWWLHPAFHSVAMEHPSFLDVFLPHWILHWSWIFRCHMYFFPLPEGKHDTYIIIYIYIYLWYILSDARPTTSQFPRGTSQSTRVNKSTSLLTLEVQALSTTLLVEKPLQPR